MNEEIFDADMYAEDECVGSVQIKFQVEDGLVVGVRFGSVQLDADAAKAMLDEVMFKARPSARHDH